MNMRPESPVTTDSDNMQLTEMFEISVDKFYGMFEDPSKIKLPRFGFDSKVVTVEDIIKMVNRPIRQRKKKKHIMLVGGIGTGKSNTIGNIASIFLDPKREHEFADIMFFYISAHDFNNNDPGTFVQLIHKSKKSKSVLTLTWGYLRKHSENVLFIIDSLERLVTEPYDESRTSHPQLLETQSTHIYNILNGKLFPKCTILTVSRPYGVEHYKGKIRPDNVIVVGDFHLDTVKQIVYSCVGMDLGDKRLCGWYSHLFMLAMVKSPWCFRAAFAGYRPEYKQPCSVAAIMINYVTGILEFDRFPIFGEKAVLNAWNKLKDLSLLGIQEKKSAYSDDDVFRRAETTKDEIHPLCLELESTGVAAQEVFVLEKDRNHFVNAGLVDFLCALKIIELPKKDFHTFITMYFGKPRYYTVRQMTCGILMKEETYNDCTKIILIGSPEDEEKKKLLLEYMAGQYHLLKNKRKHFIDFMHSLCMCVVSDDWRTIIPQDMDEVNVRDISLTMGDVWALSVCLHCCDTIGHLNVSGCGLDNAAISLMAHLLTLTNLKIKELTIDRNNIDWSSDKVVASFTNLLRKCEVKCLSMNCCNLREDAIASLHAGLGAQKIKRFSLSYNKNFGLDGMAFLGAFIMRHGVKELHINGCDLTPDHIKELKNPRPFKSTPLLLADGNPTFLHSFLPED